VTAAADLSERRLRKIEAQRHEIARAHAMLLDALARQDGTRSHLVGLGLADLAEAAARRLGAMRGTLAQYDGSGLARVEVTP
jgi:hypothetical protein